MRGDREITLYHMTLDEETRKEIFTRLVLQNATVFQETGEERRHSQDGPWRARETVIRVPMREMMHIGIGDRIVLGRCEEEIPPQESLVVNSFADNRRGSYRTWHYKIVCR